MYLLAGKEQETLTRKEDRELTVKKMSDILVALRNGKKVGLTAEDLSADDWIYVVTEDDVYNEIKILMSLDKALNKEVFEFSDGENSANIPEKIKEKIKEVFPLDYFIPGSPDEPVGYGMGDIIYSTYEPDVDVYVTPKKIIEERRYEELSYTSLMELVEMIVENKEEIKTNKNRWAIEELEDVLFSVPF